jgi:hypothetical protein
MIRSWLRRTLGIEALDARLALQRGHLHYIDQWVRNLDLALQELQSSKAASPDLKQLAASIREQMMAAKQAFPTKMSDIK